MSVTPEPAEGGAADPIAARLAEAVGPDVSSASLLDGTAGRVRRRRARRTAITSVAGSLAVVSLFVGLTRLPSGGSTSTAAGAAAASATAAAAAPAGGPKDGAAARPQSQPADCPAAVPMGDDRDAAVHLQAGPAAPALPADFSPAARLVPEQVPVAATICRYVAAPPTKSVGGVFSGTMTVPLSAALPLVSDLPILASDLSLLPARPTGQTCVPSSDDGQRVLLLLTYPTGQVWVRQARDERGCWVATNGTFQAPAAAADRLRSAYAAKAWPGGGYGVLSEGGGGPQSYTAGGAPAVPMTTNGAASTPGPMLANSGEKAAYPCAPGWYPGRQGQDEALIPGGATSIAVCDRDGRSMGTITGDKILPVVEAANALPSLPWTTAPTLGGQGCAGAPTSPPALLLVSYGRGPGVAVRLQTCPASVVGPARAANDTGLSLLTAVDRALGRS